GHRCPTVLNMINFALTGEAEWRGGLAQGPDNYILSTNLPVEGGINRVLLRSTVKPGVIELTASADGLAPATVSLNSKAVSINGGLSRDFPSDDLTPYLGRGPTPAGESFQISRRSLKVAGVTAGSN